MDLTVYSALAGVTAITTGVQVAISVPASVATWTERESWVAKGPRAGPEDRSRLRRHAGAALAAVLLGGVVNGFALAGWILEVPASSSLSLILPLAGVVLASAVCLVAGVFAAARSMLAA